VTTTHAVPAVEADSVEKAAAEMRKRGMRVSAARRVLIEALFAAQVPVSAEEIAAGLGGRVPTSDLASVYRNLETLESIGLVRHVHLGHGPGLYSLAAEIAPGWVVCDRCGARREATDAELEPVREAVRSQFGYEARFAHFPIVGLCPDCARQ
jgi:Fur family transcriptional regulator, ferric uptake regulator